MVQEPHRIGVIGLGAIGAVMIANMKAHPGFHVVCAWDPNPDARTRLLEAHPEIEIMRSAESVIAYPKINAVYIASPPLSHSAYVRAAATAGRHILCEKPLGINVAESEALVGFVAESKVANVVNFNHGNALASTYVEEALASGDIGDVTKVDIVINLNNWPRDFQAHATWLAGREQGGFTREMISHWIYLTRRLFGEGEISYRKAHFPAEPGVAEIRLLAELAFGDIPTVINANCGGAGPVGTEYTIWGTRMSCRLHSGGRYSVTRSERWHEKTAEADSGGHTDIMRNLDATSDIFSGKTRRMATLADALAVQRIVEALIA